MAQIRTELRRFCPRCGENVDFQIEMCYVDYNGVIPCFRCPKCNVRNPAYSFNEFLEDGRVHIYV